MKDIGNRRRPSAGPSATTQSCVVSDTSTPKDIGGLASADAVAAFLTRLDYPTGCRKKESATAYGLSSETADASRRMELLAADDDRFFRVLFVQLRSVTAKARCELARHLFTRQVMLGGPASTGSG